MDMLTDRPTDRQITPHRQTGRQADRQTIPDQTDRPNTDDTNLRTERGPVD